MVPQSKEYQAAYWGPWYLEREVAVINTVVIPVEQSLADIGMNDRKVLIIMWIEDEAY